MLYSVIDFLDTLNNFVTQNELEVVLDYRSIFIYTLIINCVLVLVCFILKGFGLLKLAKNHQPNMANLAFIPFANFILIGKLAGELRIIGKKTDKNGVIFLVTYLLYLISSITFELLYCLSSVKTLLETNTLVLPDAKMTVATSAFYIAEIVFQFAFIIVSVMTYFAFLRRFNPSRSVFILGLLSVFVDGPFMYPILFCIFIFAFRNNKKVDNRQFSSGQNNWQSYNQNPNGYNNPFSEYENQNDTAQNKTQNNINIFEDYPDDKTDN